jgi:hypothetical protein
MAGFDEQSGKTATEAGSSGQCAQRHRTEKEISVFKLSNCLIFYRLTTFSYCRFKPAMCAAVLTAVNFSPKVILKVLT